MGAFGPEDRPQKDWPGRAEPPGDPPPAAVRAVMQQGVEVTAPPAEAVPVQLPERRTWVDPAACRIIACVDVEPVGRDQSGEISSSVLWGLAVRRMERCIRPGDWICMLGASRIAVCFGNGAHRIPPSALGGRLVRAMGDHLAVGSSSADLDVAVGIGIGQQDLDGSEVVKAAMASIRSARHHRSSSVPRGRRVVAVARVPESFPSHAPGTAKTAGVHSSPAHRPRLVRRTFFPIGDGAGQHANGTLAPAGLADTRRPRRDAALRVLVVDPTPVPTRTSGLASGTVASLTRRVGALPTLSKARTPDAVLLDHFVVEPDVVLLVVHDEIPSSTRDFREPWRVAVSMTKVLRDTGTPVLAVGFGASAVAVSACMERGAIGVFDVEQVPEELVRLVRSDTDEPAALEPPAQYKGLMELTPAERRVLYQMMRGRSAVEIAGERTVSLSTVRTHIRSILRKLNVNSQLAAVAIANGFGPPVSSSA